jgi:hypothetical protein
MFSFDVIGCSESDARSIMGGILGHLANRIIIHSDVQEPEKEKRMIDRVNVSAIRTGECMLG